MADRVATAWSREAASRGFPCTQSGPRSPSEIAEVAALASQSGGMIPQRITDYLRERRIRGHVRSFAVACSAGDSIAKQRAMDAVAAEVKQRSPEQVARMERAMGLA